jgi:hypothetical protein
MHFFGNAPICATPVLECGCCKIYRYVAALTVQKAHINFLSLYYIVHEALITKPRTSERPSNRVRRVF